jgi:hypothetical protein
LPNKDQASTRSRKEGLPGSGAARRCVGAREHRRSSCTFAMAGTSTASSRVPTASAGDFPEPIQSSPPTDAAGESLLVSHHAVATLAPAGGRGGARGLVGRASGAWPHLREPLGARRCRAFESAGIERVQADISVTLGARCASSGRQDSCASGSTGAQPVKWRESRSLRQRRRLQPPSPARFRLPNRCARATDCGNGCRRSREAPSLRTLQPRPSFDLR